MTKLLNPIPMTIPPQLTKITSLFSARYSVVKLVTLTLAIFLVSALGLESGSFAAPAVKAEKSSSPRILKPVDEAIANRDFLAFRSRLEQAVREKDSKYLLAHVSPTIRTSFGVENGKTEFIKHWKLGSAATAKASPVWRELTEVLSLGGRFNHQQFKGFVASYVFTDFPEDLDPFSHGAVVGQDVTFRSTPSLTGKSLGKLSYHLVKILDSKTVPDAGKKSTYQFLKIQTLNGTTGYMAAQYIRNPVDYRAFFEKNKAGEWEMVTFVAGD